MRNISSPHTKLARRTTRWAGLVLGALAMITTAGFAVGGSASAAMNGHMIRIQIPDAPFPYWPKKDTVDALQVYVKGVNNDGNKACTKLDGSVPTELVSYGAYQKPEWWWKGEIEVIMVDRHGDLVKAYRALSSVPDRVLLVGYTVEEFKMDEVSVPWRRDVEKSKTRMFFEQDSSWVPGTEICPPK